MKILFLHQNFPGQFLHLAPALAKRGHEVLALTREDNKRPSPVKTLRYRFTDTKLDAATVRLGRSYAEHCLRGEAVARACLQLRDRESYVPDVIFGHIGWGECLFLRTVWPQAKLLVHAEFFYRPEGLDTGFDPEFRSKDPLAGAGVFARTAHLTLAMMAADKALAPTQFQAATFPDIFQDKISVIHEGIDCAAVKELAARGSMTLPGEGNRVLTRADKVVSFVARSLEPYRGVHSFLRALPALQQAHKDAEIVIVGGDGVSYGAPAPDQKKWKDIFLGEVKDQLDLSRIHFTGRLAYPDLIALFGITRAHVYLTYPFVLSWSMLEAMAAGALIIGSDTPPVREIIRGGENGLLVDFFDSAAIAAQISEVLSAPERFAPLAAKGQSEVLQTYDLQGICLPQLIDFVESAKA